MGKKAKPLTEKDKARQKEADEKKRAEEEAAMPSWQRQILHALRERDRKVQEWCDTNPEWQAHLKRDAELKKNRREALAKRIKQSQKLADPRTKPQLRQTLLTIVEHPLANRITVHQHTEGVELEPGQDPYFQPKMLWRLTRYMRDKNNVYWYEFEGRVVWGDWKVSSYSKAPAFRLRYSHLFDIRNIITKDILGHGMYSTFFELVHPATPFPEAEGITGYAMGYIWDLQTGEQRLPQLQVWWERIQAYGFLQHPFVVNYIMENAAGTTGGFNNCDALFDGELERCEMQNLDPTHKTIRRRHLHDEESCPICQSKVTKRLMEEILVKETVRPIPFEYAKPGAPMRIPSTLPPSYVATENSRVVVRRPVFWRLTAWITTPADQGRQPKDWYIFQHVWHKNLAFALRYSHLAEIRNIIGSQILTPEIISDPYFFESVDPKAPFPGRDVILSNKISAVTSWASSWIPLVPEAIPSTVDHMLVADKDDRLRKLVKWFDRIQMYGFLSPVVYEFILTKYNEMPTFLNPRWREDAQFFDPNSYSRNL
jgi:hypothetical protein